MTNKKTSPFKSLTKVTKGVSREARRPWLFGSRVPALNPCAVILLGFDSSKKNIYTLQQQAGSGALDTLSWWNRVYQGDGGIIPLPQH